MRVFWHGIAEQALGEVAWPEGNEWNVATAPAQDAQRFQFPGGIKQDVQLTANERAGPKFGYFGSEDTFGFRATAWGGHG